MHEEYARLERADGLGEITGVDATAGGAGETVGEPRLVALGLQAADEPRAGVGERLVVEVHGVLGGHHDTEPERARLLEQGEKWLLGRRILDGRHETEDLVHICLLYTSPS